MPDRTEDGADHTACGLPIGNLTSQLWGNFFMDGMDHWITEEERQGAYARYTDDFLLFSDSKERLAALHAGITAHLATLQLKLAVPKSRLLACAEGVPFCGFRFLPGQSPWVLGATKHRFEARRSRLKKAGDTHALSLSTFAWYQFSREGNTEGLLRAYARSKCRPHGISWPRLRDCQHPRRMVEVPCGTLCQP